MNAEVSIRPKGVIFDLDGTLYRMRWYLRAALIWKVFPHVLRLPRFLSERDRFAGINMGTREHLMQEIGKSLAHDEKCSAEEIRTWIDRSFYPAFIAAMKLFRNSRPGLTAMISSLKNCGIKIGVLSDYAFVNERLECLGIEGSLFDTTASSETFGALKPSPIPFLSMALEWGIEPADVLVVGDRDDTDGAAARASGMRFRGVTDSHSVNVFFKPWNDVRNELLSFCTAQT